MKNIDNMIQSLYNLKLAFRSVNKNWEQCDYMNDLKENDYPFEVSFDELNIKVENWINQSIQELKSFKD